MEYLVGIFFLAILICLMTGYPVAFVLGGISAVFGYFLVPDFLDFLPLRIMGVLQNNLLMSIPMFIMMGLVLEKTGIAENLLRSMGKMLYRFPGGLAVSVVLVGGVLAASTGIVGATVVTMGLISLPVMLKSGYNISLSTGIIAASGTLGQIIPPSVILILLGSVLQVPVGDLFKAAIVPGILLMVFYILYVMIFSFFTAKNQTLTVAQQAYVDLGKEEKSSFVSAMFFPLLLIFLVLGSIFYGVASPTEASALGAAGALCIAIIKRRMTLSIFKKVMKETSELTTMVFFILLGATTFALVFRGMDGDDLLTSFVTNTQLTSVQFFILVMVLVFIAGFFIDFIEIIFIIVPVVAPVFMMYKIDLIWLGILLAINLQTSFLTPPFGFALFYLKGVTPPEVKTSDVYRGVIPFILIQVLVFIIVWIFPDILIY
ncbi:MAG: TRAP transporter large permease subunit [Saprospiraceae bacterium]|nr:TRAP transporter large permease subunit [Saprospiraceae bacterium]MBK8370628.1 TRAP transporter large permease subunit [Saprospiraceae bacterium]MBK8817575.1 TRAP transporter large permease subunit [Saprospiraceae bacterium]MBK8854520.1 TRAP transporter large permease subunit [Saprospiraceae bacterium]